MTIEEQIRHYRKQAGLSQEKMAEMIGVSRQAVTKWENGTGVPDIANLMAVADLFKISVDELLSNNTAEKKPDDFLYESATEYDIDGKKNFDLKLGGAREVRLKAYDGEKIMVSLLSNVLNELRSNYKIKIDDIKNRIDVDINRLNGATESEAKEELTIRILVPHKYTGRLELSVNAGKLDISGFESDLIEADGKIREVILRDNKGEIEINSNLDMQIRILSHKGAVGINQISATSRMTVPAKYDFRAVKKGIATSIYYEHEGKKTEDFSNPEADNYIELNGLKSELIISAIVSNDL